MELINKQDLISRSLAIDYLTIKANMDGAYGYISTKEIYNYLSELPSAESEKAYTKADYIMALHKEYGCTLTRAEEAHNKALEYLRSKAMMKG